MEKHDSEWKEEQERVTGITKLLKGHIRQLSEELGLHRSDVVDMRKDFWEEVTVNFSSPDDLGETSTSLRQQAQILNERERHHLQSSKALKKYKKLVVSPYFGRIDFTETPNGEVEKIYLGIGSLMEDNGTFLIYDWRAPISSLYYDGAPGPAVYDTPGGLVSGTMELKRQFVIDDGVIEVMFDTGVTIGDELLQQVLSHSADDRMKSIVATIQKEQNAVIRNDKSRMLVVQELPEAVKPQQLCSGSPICSINTARCCKPIKCCCSRPIRCSTVMSPLFFRSLVKKICSRQRSRCIWSTGWATNFNWRMYSAKRKVC